MKKIVTTLLALLFLLMAGCAQKATATYKDLVGSASDYSDPNNWMYLPENATLDADVIFLYPTAYSDEDGASICEISDASMRQQAQATYAAMGSVFEGVGNIFVPYYRQINGAKFLEMTDEEIRNYGWKEPRTDLYAALDYYFENLNNGRPYILSGHSQGSNMLNIILDEYMELHPAYYERMITAYMIGCALTQDLLDENQHLKAAQGADDLGAIVSWNTEGPGNADAESLVVMDHSISINPLNWKTDDAYAGVAENKGSYMPDADGNYSLVEGIADAKVDTVRGVVVCESVDPATYAVPMADIFGPESYHGYDYGFYYMNIRENAALRVETWFKAK